MIKSSTCALFTAAAVAAMAFAVGGATMAHAKQSSPAGRSVAAIDGKYDYKEHCAVCHDLSGTADGILADFLKSGTVVPSLTALSKKKNGVFPFTRVYRTIDGTGP